MHEATKATMAGVWLALALPSSAFAQVQTTFDFETPGSDQSGEYRAEPGAEIADGVGRLSLRPGWGDESLSLRVAYEVRNEGPAVDGAWVDIPGRTLPMAFRAAVDGTRVAVYDDEGRALDAMLVGTALVSGRIRIRVPRLPRAMSTLYLYAGASDPLTTDERTSFTPADPVGWPVVGGAFGASSFTVTSMVDDNTVRDANGSTTLGALESSTFTAAQAGTTLQATGPIQVSWDGGDADSMPPPAFAGRKFVTPAPRYDETIEVYAFTDTTVTITQPPLGEVDLPADTPTRLDTFAEDGESIVFEASTPVLAARGSTTGSDITPLVPATHELFGVATGTILVSTGPADASVSVYRSDGMDVLLVPPNTSVSVTGGSMGSGAAVRLVSDQPIGAVTYADGDGAEMVALLPPELMGTEFALPVGAQYVAIATQVPNVDCALFDAAGMEVTRQTSAGAGPDSPGRILFGSSTTMGSNIAAPARLHCDAAAWAMMEVASTNTEQMLVAASNNRPAVGPLTVIPGDVEDPRASSSAVITPTWNPPQAIDRFTGFAVVTDFDPQFQVSFDEGQTWRIPRDGAFVEAVPTAVEPAEAFVDVEFSPTRSITLRARLEGEGPVSIDEVTLEAPGEEPTPDAGPTGDAGSQLDAGVDSGDGDGDGDGAATDGGCGCASGSKAPDGEGWLFMLALACLVGRRTRD